MPENDRLYGVDNSDLHIYIDVVNMDYASSSNFCIYLTETGRPVYGNI